MRTVTARAPSLKAEVKVTPMIDILLVLLIIFMLISPNLSVGLDSQIPPAGADATARDQEKALVLSIGENLSILINQEPIGSELLRDRLSGILKSRTQRTVFIQAASELSFEIVTTIIDLAKEAGADRIGLMTETLPHAGHTLR